MLKAITFFLSVCFDLMSYLFLFEKNSNFPYSMVLQSSKLNLCLLPKIKVLGLSGGLGRNLFLYHSTLILSVDFLQVQASKNMKLKVGNSVEVLRKENDLCMSWFSGKVMAVDGDDFIVRYMSLIDRKEVMAVERVYRKAIRPRPPHAKKEKGWIVGDMVEVFDTKCWKVGKVAKVGKNNRVVIRFLGSIQLKEFDECNLRIRQAWDQNKWSVIEKVKP